jgi:PAS domain S-box-containing protein
MAAGIRWMGAVACASLGLGMALAAIRSQARGTRKLGQVELVELVVAIALIATGAILVSMAAGRYGDEALARRPDLVAIGVACLASGSAVVAAELSRPGRNRARAAANAVAGATCAVLGVWMVSPLQQWQTLFWLGAGALLVATPWVGNRLSRVDVHSLRARLALFTAGLTVLVLIVAIAVDTYGDERVLTDQALLEQRQVAFSAASQLSDHLAYQRTAVLILAQHPDFATLTPDAQQSLLNSAHFAYPDQPTFVSYDRNGNPVARSGDGPLPASGESLPMLAAVRQRRTTTFDAGPSVLDASQMSLLVGAPVLDANGDFSGAVLGMSDLDRLTVVVRRAAGASDQAVYVLDRSGRIVAPVGGSMDPFVIQQVVTSSLGVQRFRDAQGERLVGFAAIGDPEWHVVIENPLPSALAHVTQSRANAFNLMLVVMVIAASAAAVAAGALIMPLRSFSRAAEAFASGADAPLPRSQISEIAQLAGSFAHMRDRLAARSADQAQAEAALRDTHRTLAALISASPLAVVLIDAQGRIESWNPAAETLLGWRANEAVGQPLAALVERDVDDVRAATEEVLAGAHFSAVETQRRMRNGEMARVVVWTAPLEPGDTSRGSVVMLADIAERTRAEEERARRVREEGAREEAEAVQRRLAFLADASNELNSTLDLQQTLHLAAKAPVPELADGCALDLLDDEGTASRAALTIDPGTPDRPTVEKLLAWSGEGSTTAQVLQTGASVLRVIEPPEEGGPRAWMMSVPLSARERLMGALTLVSVRSENPFTEVALALAEALARRGALAIDNARLYAEAQEALRIRDTFLSIASHELRTPLTRMKAYTEVLLLADAQAELDEPLLTRSLRSIDRATDRLAAITQDLLDVSRLRGGDLPLRPQQLDLIELIRGVAERYERHLDASHSLAAHLPRGRLPVVVDAGRMEQVLDNLLDNAVKYSPEGGPITIEARAESAGALIQVCDQGMGVPSGAGESIFEPFGRASNAEERNVPGMGLGLYICRQIVANHGGRMWVVSPGEGGGTTVNLWLPADPARPRRRTARRSRHGQTNVDSGSGA